jgi:four helix bundle protein
MTSEELYNLLLQFAIKCQKLVKKLPYAVYNREYGEQLIRSSASPGANYIEALEAMSKKDFIHRLKICRKEAKESIHWLTLLQHSNEELTWVKEETTPLISEARGYIRIFTSSILTSEKNQKITK